MAVTLDLRTHAGSGEACDPDAATDSSATAPETARIPTGGLIVPALRDAGVDEVMVRLHDVGHPGALETFTAVIDEFR